MSLGVSPALLAVIELILIVGCSVSDPIVQDLMELPEPKALDFGGVLSSDVEEPAEQDAYGVVERDYAVGRVLTYYSTHPTNLFVISPVVQPIEPTTSLLPRPTTRISRTRLRHRRR